MIQMVRGWRRALRRQRMAHPRFLAAEAMVGSPRYEYGGTSDAFVKIDEEPWRLDYKTGSGVYPDAALHHARLTRA